MNSHPASSPSEHPLHPQMGERCILGSDVDECEAACRHCGPPPFCLRGHSAPLLLPGSEKPHTRKQLQCIQNTLNQTVMFHNKEPGPNKRLIFFYFVVYLRVQSAQIVLADVRGMFTDGAFCSLQCPTQLTTNALKPLQQFHQDIALLQSVCDAEHNTHELSKERQLIVINDERSETFDTVQLQLLPLPPRHPSTLCFESHPEFLIVKMHLV